MSLERTQAAMTRPSAMPPPGDQRVDPLVEQARAGEVRAWAQLYQEHFDRVFRRLCFFLGEVAVAEDLTQETFARAVTTLASFDGRSSFATWLVGIALNVARNYLRSQQAMRRAEQRLRSISELTMAPRNVVDGEHLQQQRIEVLYTVLYGLPEALRSAFILRELEQLSTAEAGERLGISPGNVAVRAHRARELVRKELIRRGWVGATGETTP